MTDTIDIHLIREINTDQGTEGFLSVPELCFSAFTLELPWRDNRQNVSCIPAGTYPLVWHHSKKFKAFHAVNVPGRSNILIHAGNLAGDTELGFKTNVEGCILLGCERGELYGQRAVLHSRAAVNKFNTILLEATGNGRKARIIIDDRDRAYTEGKQENPNG